MPPLSQKQLYGIVFVLAALAGVLAMNKDVVLYAAGIAAVSVVSIAMSGGGVGGSGIPVGFRDAIDRAAAGKKPEPPAGAPNEVLELYAALNRVASTIDESDTHAKKRMGEVDAQAGHVEDAVKRISDSVAGQVSQSEQAARSIKEVTSSLREIAQHVEVLAASAEESSSSILEMTATNDEMAEHIGELSQSVRESVSSIEEMTYSIKEVAKNVDALSLTAEETSSSMNEMDVSIDQVQSNANETARLSEEVARDAEHGAESI